MITPPRYSPLAENAIKRDGSAQIDDDAWPTILLKGSHGVSKRGPRPIPAVYPPESPSPSALRSRKVASILKYFLAISASTESMGGTTLAIMIPVMSVAERFSSAKRFVNHYSVFIRSLVPICSQRQSARSVAPWYKPRTVLVADIDDEDCCAGVSIGVLE